MRPRDAKTRRPAWNGWPRNGGVNRSTDQLREHQPLLSLVQTFAATRAETWAQGYCRPANSRWPALLIDVRRCFSCGPRSLRADDRSRLDLWSAGCGGGWPSWPFCELVPCGHGEFCSNLDGEGGEPVMPGAACPGRASVSVRAASVFPRSWASRALTNASSGPPESRMPGERSSRSRPPTLQAL